jgi:hypothetical protein
LRSCRRQAHRPHPRRGDRRAAARRRTKELFRKAELAGTYNAAVPQLQTAEQRAFAASEYKRSILRPRPDPDFDPKPPPRFQLTPFEDIKIERSPNYLVKGIIPRGGLVVAYGAPKNGKSLLVFDLVMHVAIDRPYRGRRVQRGTVVYLALEGGRGFAARKEAWCQRHFVESSEPVPFHLLACPLDLIADHAALIATIRARVADIPAVIAIDNQSSTQRLGKRPEGHGSPHPGYQCHPRRLP